MTRLFKKIDYDKEEDLQGLDEIGDTNDWL